ncbi:hypothetical protein [Cylindrospermum sp. FACHB-282]|uniref:hypothetical protein n=1 Tax=Cylindrospermum sp. FACHB-282 TaxID=2692794 RepID=UPI0016875B8D|nr:hypothetical protein [Cylindrospermum sp. FACHB-282]MBD2386925.1 hypothetical protein [Cylindrospermum sp. FACHB-282]
MSMYQQTKEKNNLAVTTVEELRKQLEPFEGQELVVATSNGFSYAIKEVTLSDVNGDVNLVIENSVAADDDSDEVYQTTEE